MSRRDAEVLQDTNFGTRRFVSVGTRFVTKSNRVDSLCDHEAYHLPKISKRDLSTNAFITHLETTNNDSEDANHEPNGPRMAASMIVKADSVLHQRQSYNYPAPFSNAQSSHLELRSLSFAPSTLLPSQIATVVPLLSFRILYKTHLTIRQSRLMIPTIRILGSVHDIIHQLDNTTSITASYHGKNDPLYPCRPTLSSREALKLVISWVEDNIPPNQAIVHKKWRSSTSAHTARTGSRTKRKLLRW